MTAIAGTYADLKFIKTRSVAQVVVEVPIEHAGRVVDLFGTPRPNAEVWVALARLDPKKMQPTVEAESPPPAAKKSRAQMAGILCNDPAFHAFLAAGRCPPRLLGVTMNADTAAMAVREMCEVETRADLDRDEFAASQWDALYADFRRSRPVPDEHLPARIG